MIDQSELSIKIFEIEKQIRQLNTKRVYQDDIPPNTIKQRHVEAMIIFRGLEADLPDGTTEKIAYFCTDSNKLKIWNGTAWVSTTLS